MSEYADAPGRALFANMGIGTLYPALNHPAKARLALKELAPVSDLRVELINQTSLLNIHVTPIHLVDPDINGFISLPITLVPLSLGTHSATWAISGTVDDHHFRRLTTIEIIITDSLAKNTMRQNITPIAIPELHLPEPQNSAQSVAPTAAANRNRPIVFLKGLDGFGTDSGADVNSGWNNMMTSLQSYGWSNAMSGVAFYECDENYNINIENYGKPGASDIHSLELGGRSQGENHHNEWFCSFLQGPIGTHDSDTTLQHLAYHWSWAMSSIFGTGCIEVVGHSMGGLIMRYAAQRIEANDPDFPNDLCIEDAVTLGVPHGGSDGDVPYGAETCTNWAYQCRQMLPTSNFISWLGTYARNPQAAGGTDWTAMGSLQDSSVSAYHATTDNFDPDHAYVYSDHEHSSAQASGSQKHWRNSDSNSISAKVRATEADIGPERTYNNYPYVNLATDKSLAYDNWGCGQSESWRIVDQLVITGEPYSSSNYCQYSLVVPSGQDNLMVTVTSPHGDDIDLVLRYGSSTSTPKCTRTSTASTETCNISNPSSGTWYITVSAAGPSHTKNPFLLEADYSVVVDDLTSTDLTSYPSNVVPFGSYSICWRVEGAGDITHTDLHYGTSSLLGSTTTDKVGTAPQTFCTNVLVPSSGSTLYIKSHAIGPNDNIYSTMYTIPIISGQDDCGTGSDAGGTASMARTITLPVNCQGELTSTDTEDWYEFWTNSGDAILASMTPQSGADFDLCLYTPSDSSVSCSNLGSGATDSISYTASSTGWWSIRVYQVTGTGTYSLSISAGDLIIRDDDGSRESYADIDYSDDTARKRLVLPSGATTGRTSATLYAYGQAVNCGSGGIRWEMEANGYVASTFDTCSKWPSTNFGWASFNVPLSYLNSGATNTFYLDHISGDWNDNAVLVGIDTNTSPYNSDIVENSASMGGELMWYLQLA